jgi:uncharacterized protein (DUF58 family)
MPHDMLLTVQFVILAGFGAALIGMSGLFAPMMPVGVAVIALSVVMAAMDIRWLRRIHQPEIRRHTEEKLSLGVPNAIRLEVRNSSEQPLHLLVRDEYPEGLVCDENQFEFDIAPRSERELAYHVTPHHRGDFGFGDIYIRVVGRLGLAVKQLRLRSEEPVCVYPNLQEIRRHEMVAVQARLARPGLHRARIRGRGTEFESLRDYVPDDDMRAVDWKASAKRGKLVTRLYQEEKSQNIVLVLDCGRIMGPVIEGLTRLDHAINAATMLAHVAAVSGDRVGMLAFGDRVLSYLPPKGGKSQTLSILKMTYNLKDAEGDSNYAHALSYLARRWTRRSLVMVFTDLVEPEASRPVITQLLGLSRKHLCVCVAMGDPSVDRAASGLPESGEEAFTMVAARQVLEGRKRAAAQLEAAGVNVLDVNSDELSPAVVDEYLRIKSLARL